MEAQIGTLVVAGLSLIGFITTFVKIGARFAVLETEVKNLKESDNKKEEKLDLIQKTVQNIEVQLAVLIESKKTYKKEEVK